MSFAAEMKDFLGAWQAGAKINASRTDQEYKEVQTQAATKKMERENDPETLALEDKKARADLAAKNAQIGSIGASTALTNERRKSVIQARDFAVKDRDALTNAPNTNGIELPPLEGLKSAIPMYEEGGLVEEEDDGETEEFAPAPAPAAPAYQQAIPSPGSGNTDFSAQSRQPAAQPQQQGLNGVVAPAAVFDATKAGLGYGMRAAGLDKRGIKTRAAALQAQQLASGTGGMTQKEMDQVRKAVDPEGKMTDSQRNMASLGAVYQFNMKKGNIGGAEKIAFGMLQHFRVASQRYAAIAAVAAKDGNVDLATAAAMKSYANVPDGRDLKIVKGEDGRLQYSVIDENGKQIMKGIATPQELAAQAMGMATGGFDKAILNAAGQRAAAAPKESSYNAQPLDKRVSGLEDYAQKQKEAYLESDAGKKAIEANKAAGGAGTVDEHFDDIKDFATHLVQDNPKVTPREAFKAAQALASIDKTDPGKQPFKAEATENGMFKLTLNNGLKMNLSEDQFDVVMNKRAAQLKAMDSKQDSEQDAADDSKKGYGELALDVGRAVAKPAGEMASQAGNIAGILGRGARDAVVGAIPDELAIRGKSAINRTADVLREKYGAISNPGDVPPIDAPM